MNTEIMLALVALCTSTITGIIGVGGGLLLIAVMPVFLPAALIIPMHSVTQVASNASRALLALKSVEWRLFPGFFFGSALGVSCFGLFFASLPSQYLPIGIGSYILLSLWSHRFDRLVRRYETFFFAGFFQTGLGMIVGATGPLTTTLMAKSVDDKEKIIATNAFFMMITHLFKIVFIAALGFAYLEHGVLMLSMVSGAVVGSWLGTLIRGRIDGEKYIIYLKWSLSLLAVYMIMRVCVSYLTIVD
jgi:uncharacterized membrane protein YfcA